MQAVIKYKAKKNTKASEGKKSDNQYVTKYDESQPYVNPIWALQYKPKFDISP